MVRYPIQAGLPNCGAFAIAYYNWHSKDEKVKEEKEGLDEIDEIYDQIKFGADAPIEDLEDYSDTVKIMDYLIGDLKVSPIFYYTGGGIVEELLNAMKLIGSNKVKIDNWVKDEKIKKITPPTDKNGYLISLCTQIKPDEVGNADKITAATKSSERVHYTLIRFRSGDYKMFNSWDGTSKVVTERFINGAESIASGKDDNHLLYLKSGIWIEGLPE